MISYYNYTIERGEIEGGLSLYPRLAVCGNFFFPDGDGGFQSVDDVAAGFECLGAVRGGDDDDDAGLSDFEATKAVGDRDVFDAPALCGFCYDEANLLLGHFGVDIVFKVAHLFSAGVVAYNSLEDGDATDAGMAYGCDKGVPIKWFVGELDEGFDH